MERYIHGRQPERISMVPFCLDDLIGAENPVRFIRDFVDHLDLKALEFQRIRTASTGRKPYSPRLFLKPYLYAHLNRIRLSRLLERECRRNIKLMWPLECLYPDHNTIAIFRAVNRKSLVFKLFVRLCMDLGLCATGRVCVDGTTIKTVNGMNAQDQADQGSPNRPFALDVDPGRLPEPEDLKRRIAIHEARIERMERQGETQLTFTDPDARMMPSKRSGLKACYNIRRAIRLAGGVQRLIARFRARFASGIPIPI